jgi:E3 ubiquitin ligase SMURF1/2
VQREWYSLMAQAFLDHDIFLARSLGLNPSYEDKDHFLALGRFLARAIIDGQVLPFTLTVPLFKALLGTPLSIHDVRYIDETTYNSLVYVRDSDCIEALDLDFTWTTAAGRTVELVAGGSDLAVTRANQAQYVDSLVQYWLLDAVKTPLELVVRGFYDVLTPDMMFRFDYRELELLLCGTSEINVVEWQFETVATSELRAHESLGWFWDVIEKDMRQHERAKLLQFTTGSSRVPLQGFKALTGHDGQLCPFNLRNAPYTEGALPKVHTCFNRIVLPLYPTRKLMKEALFILVNMEVQDFTMK